MLAYAANRPRRRRTRQSSPNALLVDRRSMSHCSPRDEREDGPAAHFREPPTIIDSIPAPMPPPPPPQPTRPQRRPQSPSHSFRHADLSTSRRSTTNPQPLPTPTVDPTPVSTRSSQCPIRRRGPSPQPAVRTAAHARLRAQAALSGLEARQRGGSGADACGWPSTSAAVSSRSSRSAAPTAPSSTSARRHLSPLALPAGDRRRPPGRILRHHHPALRARRLARDWRSAAALPIFAACPGFQAHRARARRSATSCAFMRQRSREQVIGAALALLVTAIIVIEFVVDAKIGTAPPPQVDRGRSSIANRTDADIVADQKKDMAERGGVRRKKSNGNSRSSRNDLGM